MLPTAKSGEDSRVKPCNPVMSSAMIFISAATTTSSQAARLRRRRRRIVLETRRDETSEGEAKQKERWRDRHQHFSTCIASCCLPDNVD
ncbi:jg5366 [Pararge aegeria aegeria]|uniref:Jg5366 protein n=1 Tax=Pararge aegeria aegeria TaxID=348720 RepID=A0A8S4QTL6_9NEOP|nr:jg5366 [Pararge aegeria aegeria]